MIFLLGSLADTDAGRPPVDVKIEAITQKYPADVISTGVRESSFMPYN